MNLRINNWKYALKWIVGGILTIVFLTFLIRVISFENYYYDSKEGSERDIPSDALADQGEELIEIKPSESEVKEYTVPSDYPRYLSIERLGINNVRVLPMGVNPSGELATPNNIFDVGWYEGSGKPGHGGTLLIDGHNGGPNVYGVFKNLPSMVEGDSIVIERGDGVIFKYVVTENKTVSLEDSDAYMTTAAKSPEKGKESITLISCSGEWSQKQGTYLSRQFVRAVLAD